MSRNDPRFLIISRRVPCEFQNLRGQVFHHCRLINRGSRCNPIMVCCLPQISVNPADWKLEASFCRARYSFSPFGRFSSPSRHLVLLAGDTHTTRESRTPKAKWVCSVILSIKPRINQSQAGSQQRSASIFGTASFEECAWRLFSTKKSAESNRP